MSDVVFEETEGAKIIFSQICLLLQQFAILVHSTEAGEFIA